MNAGADHTLLDAAAITQLLRQLAADISERFSGEQGGERAFADSDLVLVGVRTGGAHLAARLQQELAALRGEPPALGILDITLYRDDVLLGAQQMPVLRGTEIDFDVEGRYLVLVDDVLFTGRTVRAALDALLDLGRPGCVRLAVLVDRGLRELPVAADWVGHQVDTTLADRVEVRLTESGHAEDAVVIADRDQPRQEPQP